MYAATAHQVVDNNTLALNFERLLAAKVHQNPILYDRNHKHHIQSTNAVLHRQVWSSISEELNLEVDSCISLWTCIKQKYIKNRKRLSNGEPFKHWPLFGILQSWLDEHIKRRRSRSDICKQIRSAKPISKVPQIKLITKTTAPFPSQMKRKFIEFEQVYDDSIESAEWCEIPDETDKVKPIPTGQLKRKAITYPSAVIPKRKLKVNESSDSDSAELFTELEETPTRPPPSKLAIQSVNTRLESTPNKRWQLTRRIIIKPQTVSLTSKPSQNAVTQIVEVTNHKKEAPPAKSNRAILELSVATKPATEPPITIPTETPTKKPEETPAVVLPQPSTPVAALDKLEQVIGRCVQLVEKCINQSNQKDSNEVFGKFVASMVRDLPAEKRIAARVEILQFAGELVSRLNGDE